MLVGQLRAANLDVCRVRNSIHIKLCTPLVENMLSPNVI